jgi:CIC family chloride channel protein
MSLDDVRQQLVESLHKRVPSRFEAFSKLKFPGWHTSRTIRLVTLSVLLGIIGALAGGVFLGMLHLAERTLLTGITGFSPPSLVGEGPGTLHNPATNLWLIPLSTTLGGFLSGLLVYWVAPSTEQSGMDAVIRSFHQQGGSMSVRVPMVKAVASALTMGSGGSVGREGPMAQIGAALGNLLAKPLHLSVPDRRILVLAGVAAGISAIFKSPLGAALVAVEVLYCSVDFEVDALMYTIISASVGYAVSGLYGGWEPLFQIPPDLQLNGPIELIWYSLLGVIAGGVGLLLPYVLHAVDSLFDRVTLPQVLRPAIGGLLVGLVGLALPQILGGGYGWLEQAMQSKLSLGLLAALVFAKIIATSLTIGSGGSGGVFAPALFIGGMLGSALALSLHSLFPEATGSLEVAAMAIVGMAALFSGVARAPVSTLVMAAELTGGYGLLVPTMIATVTAFLISQSFESRFHPDHPLLYRSQLPTRLHSPTHQSEYIQNILSVMDNAEIELEHGSMSWRELELHLRQGDPIPMGPDGEFLYSAHVDEESPFAGERIRDLPLVSDEVLIASIMRQGHHITPRGNTTIEPDDLLMVIADEEQLPQLGRYVDVIRYEETEPSTADTDNHQTGPAPEPEP